MKLRLLVLAFASLSAVALSACGPSCEDICQHAVDVCNKDLTDAKLDPAAEKTKCETNCKANEDDDTKCTNIDDIKDCINDTTVCADFAKCPVCTVAQ